MGKERAYDGRAGEYIESRFLTVSLLQPSKKVFESHLHHPDSHFFQSRELLHERYCVYALSPKKNRLKRNAAFF